MKSLNIFTLVFILCTATELVNSETYFIHSDHLNTPQMLTDKDQNVVWKADIDPFGNATVDEDPDGDGQSVTMNLRLPGQYYDEETGLHYNYQRYYDPKTGRYITSDPIGLFGGINTYSYVSGNPINSTDPSGLTTNPLVAACTAGPNPGCIAGIALTGATLLAIGNAVNQSDMLMSPVDSATSDATETGECKIDKCPPCVTISGRIVPVGTIGFRPLDTPGRPQHGIDGPHHNLLRANQIPKGNPVGECDCFWQPIGAVSPVALPAGAIPAEPFNNIR